ncbi:MAG: methylmalonyl Co-A mutase-associated GTPase MeaB [Thermoplasmata archaeon]|nr:methylmalonyl Co-A mutase-associated GTPase MeaB [Thermoplasmata archaeon]
MSRARPLPAAAAAVRRGDRRALARLITRVEARDPTVAPVLSALYPFTGKAMVVGITGPLGVGKSSLINGLLAQLRRSGKRVGVIAVDPSSPFSGGSVLGDRIRIDRATEDDGIFFRSMASRGHSGGLALATREVARLLDAFGMDVVLLETVGSGQVDVEVREVATTSVVVLVPHLGDDVQTMKAGLFEIADVFCVNKADLPGADSAKRDLSELVGLASSDGWRPTVLSSVAAEGLGIPELWSAVEAHEQYLDTSGTRLKAARERAADELLALVRDRVGRELSDAFEHDAKLAALLDEVVGRSLDPRSASERLYRELRRTG